MPRRYLMLDHGGVLDGDVTTEIEKSDLVLSDLGEGLKSVLRHGVEIVKQLTELVENYDCQIVFHSKNKEEDQVRILRQLQNACLQKGLFFPTVTAMAVYDSQQYTDVSSESPVIIKNREHGVVVVGYGKDKEGKACVREALSTALNIPKEEREHHMVFDDGASVIATATQEGYQIFLIGQQGMSLHEAVDQVYQNVVSAKNILSRGT